MELADVLLLSGTELSIIPVTCGRIAPPKKSTSQISIAKVVKVSVNGTGKAEITERPPKMHCSLIDIG
jgi:hypothetical protein